LKIAFYCIVTVYSVGLVIGTASGLECL